MKRKELTKTFMMISNSMVYAKIIQLFRIKSIEWLDVTSAVSTSMRIYFLRYASGVRLGAIWENKSLVQCRRSFML